MTPSDRIAISGFGCISAIGANVAELRASVLAGKAGIKPVDFPLLPNARVSIAAQVADTALVGMIDRKTQALTDRFTQFALIAAEEAVKACGIAREALSGSRTAVIIGASIGGQRTLDRNYEAAISAELYRADPFLIPKVMPNSAASFLAIRYGITGPCLTISSACSSATQAIGLGLQMIRAGAIDRAIVGGAEALISRYNMRSWEALKVLSPDPCRPFSKGRSGMTLGEGAAIFVLERRADVAVRGQSPKCDLRGYGTTCDAKDMLKPDPDGAAAAMKASIVDSGLPADAICYVNAHGTGTIGNDASETKAVRLAFGAHADNLAMSSTKSMHGHAIGAAGAIELAVTLIALEEQIGPPTLNWLALDPACDIDCIPHASRAMTIHAAMSNNLAFGGINATLVAALADTE